MRTYICTKPDNTNANYAVKIGCQSQGVEIIAEMPEQLSFGVQSDWESRLPSTLSSLLGSIPLIGGRLEQGQNLLGLNRQFQDLSFQMWMGTSPIEIPLTLQFDAEESALNDVYRPIQALASMALPSQRGGYLIAPGPIRGGNGDDNAVTLNIGRMFTFLDCIMVSCEQTLDSRLDEDGYAIAGTANITLRTGMVYGKTDWLKAAGFGVTE